MMAWTLTALNALARWRVGRMTQLDVAPDARVDFRGLRFRPPARFSIGERSIFEGRVIADRPQATVSIGARSFVGQSTIICAARVDIGDDVLISWGCTLVDHHSHAVSWTDRRHDVAHWYDGHKDWTHVKVAPISIGHRAWIGLNTIVLAGVTIGEGAVVGAGSVVTRDVPPHTLVAGNPARQIREIVDER